MARTRSSRTQTLNTIDQITEHPGQCQHSMTVSIVEDPYRYQCEACGTKLVSLWAAEPTSSPETLDEALTRLEAVGTVELLPIAKRTHKPRTRKSVAVVPQEPIEAQGEPETQVETKEVSVESLLPTPDALEAAEGLHSLVTAVAPSLPHTQDELPAPTDHMIEDELVNHDEDERQVVATWTAAPEAYDGFGTTTVEPECGLWCGRMIRKVETPIRHVQWQRSRYGSGLYTAVGATEWAAMQAEPIFVQDNASIPVLQPSLAAPPSAETDPWEGTTIQPGLSTEEAIPVLAIETTTTQVTAPTLLERKMQMIFDTVAQGEAAVLQALKHGTLNARPPRVPSTRSAQSPAHHSGVSDAVIALVRERITQGRISQTALAKELGLGKMTVNFIVRKVGAFAHR